MNDPLIARFADACGATAPLDLRVDLAGGGVLAEGSVDQPFTLVGRDDACDVTLSDPEINPRHVWLQVLGGRVFAVDLGSRTGLTWPSGTSGSGWLDAGTPARIGPFLLRLREPVSERPSDYAPDYNPLAADSGAKARPAVALEFRNGRRAKDRWQVNRLITLIGRAAECKIHLTADDISPYHCGLVSTQTGLWVVDLSGRGVVVNGERMRVAPLPQAAELWVGRFLIGCHYQTPPPPAPPARRPSGSPTPAAGASGRLSSPRPSPNGTAVPVAPGDARVTTTPAPLFSQQPTPSSLAPEDEVELGGVPDNGGLPGSHIMADAFRLWGPNASGPMSNPILVSGSGPKPPAASVPPDALAELLGDSSLAGGDDNAIVPLLRQLAEFHARTVSDFQHSLALLARLFSRVKREHIAVLQHELARIQELTAEIALIQSEVAREMMNAAASERLRQTPDGVKPPGGWVTPSTKTPLPDTDPLPPSVAERAAERLASLQRDRVVRWQAILVLFAGP